MRPRPITLDEFAALVDDARGLKTLTSLQEVLPALEEKLNARQWDRFAISLEPHLDKMLDLAWNAFLDAQL
jgi:hypothetical protein